MGAVPKVSVIIPHFRDLSGLDRCLTALSTQTLPQDEFEVIVADNASPQGEAVVAKAIAGRASLVVVAERGAGPARNGAVAMARGRVLAFIDSDCVAESEWLAEGVAALGTYDFVGGRVRVLVDNPDQMTPTEAFERVFAFDFKTYITKQGFTGSGNLFCSRSLFTAVGGFRAQVSEDVEWSRRAVSLGYRLGYAPKAIVGHPGRRTWQDLWSKWRRVNVEMFALTASDTKGRVRWLARALALPASAVVHSGRVFVSPDLATLRQRLDALAVLYRLRVVRMIHAVQLLWSSDTR